MFPIVSANRTNTFYIPDEVILNKAVILPEKELILGYQYLSGKKKYQTFIIPEKLTSLDHYPVVDTPDYPSGSVLTGTKRFIFMKLRKVTKVSYTKWGKINLM